MRRVDGPSRRAGTRLRSFPDSSPRTRPSLIARPFPAPSRAPSPCGLDVPPGAKARALGPATPWRRRDRFLAALENSSGPRRIFLRIREERPILARRYRALPRAHAKTATTRRPRVVEFAALACARAFAQAPSGAPAVPRPPLLRSPCGLASVEAARRWHGRCLRRFRRGRGTGALPT